MIEEWKEVPGYGGNYEASSEGRIRRKGREFTMSPCPDRYGYLKVHMPGGVVKVHRIVAATFHPEKYFNGAHVGHKNSIKSDNSASNLEWITQAANNLEVYASGRRPKPTGILNPCATLTEENVIYIREKILEGRTLTSLAKEFGVHHSTISLIKHRKKWKHI